MELLCTDVKGAALILGYSDSWLYVLIKRGSIPVVKYGRRYLIPIEYLSRRTGRSEREIMDTLMRLSMPVWRCEG